MMIKEQYGTYHIYKQDKQWRVKYAPIMNWLPNVYSPLFSTRRQALDAIETYRRFGAWK